MKRKALVVGSPNAYRMNTDLLASAFGEILGLLGFEVMHLTREAKPPPLQDWDLSFYLQLGVPPLFRGLGGKKIIYNFHPVCPDGHYGPHARRDFDKIVEQFKNGWADYVFDYNPHTTQWLRNVGLPSHFVPIGFHESFVNRSVLQHGSDRDVLFLGNVGKRSYTTTREKLVAACDAELVTNCFGEDRARYTKRRGVHLSLASYNAFRTCLTLRLIVLLACNSRSIVHEETDWCPLKHEEHCLIGKHEDVPDLVREMQENPREAVRLAGDGYRYVRDNHRLRDFFEEALRTIQVL